MSHVYPPPDESETANHEPDSSASQALKPEAETTVALPTLSVEILATQVVEAVHALNILTQLALPKAGARDEARRQVSKLAEGLVELANRSGSAVEANPALKFAWERLEERLGELVSLPNPEPPARAETVALDEAQLQITIPPHLQPPNYKPAESGAHSLQRVVIASLESAGEAAMHINQATRSFSQLSWSVTNLGTNVPILALTGRVLELRPSVLVLIIEQGQHLTETSRLITDLKRQLLGMRVILLGPMLAHTNLAERLRPDLYSVEPSKAAELADQFFNPLTRLGHRLRLDVDLQEQLTSEAQKPQKLEELKVRKAEG